jgi:hypothetical protein
MKPARVKPARVAMKKLPQLTHLIFNYYRENPEELRALQPLVLCKLSRRWGTFIITCPNSEVLAAISDAQDILREPLMQLRLAKKVRLGINNRSRVETFSISPLKGITWEAEFKKAKLYR